MRYSDNYNLKLPQRGVDRANVDDLDDNFEIIDGALADDRQIGLLMYDSTATYNTGAIRGYENPTTHRVRAYRCLEDNVTGPWDATKWAQTTLAAEIENGGGGGGSSTLAGLSDVDLGTPADGEVLTYDATEGKWVNAEGGSGGASELSDLDDVTLTTPTEGQILEYNGEEWVNTDAPDVDVTKTASGNPIEISGGANAPLVKCVTEIQGSQDLHGFDKPWVGGAGTNILDESLFVYGKWIDNGNNIGDIADRKATIQYIPCNGGSSYFIGAYDNNQIVISTYLINILWYDSTYAFLSNQSVDVFGSVITSPSNASYFRIALSVNTYNCAVNFPSTVTTYSPYSNICPITAYDENTISVVGANRCDNTTNETGCFYSATGVRTVDSRTDTSALIPVEPNTNYVGSIFSKDGTRIGNVVFTEWSDDSTCIGQKEGTYITTEASTKFVRIRNYFSEASYIQNDNYYFQLENGMTPTAYEPYTSTTHTTTYPSAIYRGSEDVVNGTAITEWGMIASYAGETLPGEWISDRDEYAPGTTPTTGAQVAYELATPTTTPVTPTNLPIKSLSGYTHIESSTGEMEIEYIAKAFSPITEMVDSQISALQKMMELMLTSARETTMTASANYTTGTLIVACGALYKATTAISSGASLVVGTNISETTIAAELAALQ